MLIRKPYSIRFLLKGISIEKIFGFLAAGFLTSAATFYADSFWLSWALNLKSQGVIEKSEYSIMRFFEKEMILYQNSSQISHHPKATAVKCFLKLLINIYSVNY